MVDRKLKRRDFLKLSSVAAAGVVAAACAPQPQPTAVPAEPEAPAEQAEPTAAVAEERPVITPEMPTTRKEPPMLEELVKSGKLPPIDERIPENPAVVAQRDAIGVYGGEIRMIMFDPVWWTSCYDIIVERMLTYSDLDGKTIIPNIFESWEVTPDGKTWSIRLRKGMKWSNGDPVTTEDTRFWWEDYQLNTEVMSAPWWQFRFGGEPMKLEIIDDFNFKVTFAAPFGNFAAHLTRWAQNDAFLFPSKYLKQYHAKYTDQAKLEEMAKAEKLETWVQLFNAYNINITWGGPPHTVGFPVLSAWYVVDNPTEGLYLWERNPYYYKVDAEGNQLPYIDKLRFDYAANTEVTKLKIVQSELDIVGQHDVTMMEYPFYKENEPKANYVVGDYISSMGDRVTLFPNHVPFTEEGVLDEGLYQIVNDHRWVKALSMAIDREEINEVIFYGTARMGAMSPMPASKYYKEEYGQAWAQFDPDAANAMLDEMGLKRGPDGMRTRLDGSKLTYNIEHSGVRVGPAVAKITEMVAGYWREYLGIDATTKEIQDSLLVERKVNAQVQCAVWHADRCTDMLLHIEPDWFIPVGHQDQGGPAPKWADWYVAPDRTAEGLIEPPDEIKRLLDIFDQMTAVVDEEERVRLGQQIFDYLAENPLEIGLVLECPAPLLFNKNMRNLPKPKSYIGWDSYGLSTYQPSAFFYEGGVRA